VAIADVTIIPIGTDTPSVSAYVAGIQKVLQKFESEGLIRFQLTPMSTLIEGELPDLFKVIEAMHEVPFEKGLARAATNIRIDDRRDVARKMEDKVDRVQSRLEEME
jgi:uncharacterized protein (TIGR00106 family)